LPHYCNSGFLSLQFRHWEGEKAIGGAQFECFMKRGNNFGPREMREQKILQG